MGPEMGGEEKSSMAFYIRIGGNSFVPENAILNDPVSMRYGFGIV